MTGHAFIQPTMHGPCMHGEVECTPARHANCRHCSKPIKLGQSWGTQTWLHESPDPAGSAYSQCASSHAEPPDTIAALASQPTPAAEGEGQP